MIKCEAGGYQQQLKHYRASARQTQPILQDGRLPLTGSVVVSGAGLGLPGTNGNVFDDQEYRKYLAW